MNKNNLAINGGEKLIQKSFKKYNSIGQEELNAASEVINSGVLSKFLGAHSDDFLGGEKVKQFEQDCCNLFGSKYAVSVNSWTSGLIAAVGALDIEPGDEIIVPTWTMCATATAVLQWNAIPVFADIEPDTFNIDPNSVIKNISPRTRAIMAVDIFGHPSDMKALRKIADEHKLKIISDTAQAPLANYNGNLAGTLADIGGYSLNYHKHIHTGEGGILITDNADLANRMQLIRNHGEAAVSGMGIKNISNMLGFNFRLGEIECAIGIEQLKKLEYLVDRRRKSAKILHSGLRELKGLGLPVTKEGASHVFYIFPLILDIETLGVSRKTIFDALTAEGITGLIEGYANIHLLPMYQRKIAYGTGGFPWTAEFCDREVDYSKGICPVAEKLHNETFLGYQMCLHDLSPADLELIIKAFRKVWKILFNFD